MSFDVYLNAPACGHCGRESSELWSRNLTHNVNEIVDRCLVAGGATRGIARETGYRERSWGRLDGWKASDIVDIVSRALAESHKPARDAEFRSLEPTNGWGSLESVQKFLADLAAAVREHPNATVEAWG